MERSWRRIAWLAAALMVCLMLVAAGCGDDDEESGDGGGAADQSGGDSGGPVKFEPGQEFKGVFIPKQTGVAVFEQANQGAKEAAGELQVDEAEFLGPSSPDNCVSGQIDTVTNASTQGADAVMISNCAGDQIEPAAKQASDAGATIVSWDSPIPSGEGENLFVAQVDFDETGKVMADLALDILGEEGGEYAILSAAPDAANQNAWIKSHKEAIKDPKYKNLKLVDTVYGNDDSEKSYDEALGLVDKHPTLKMIMAPTTVGIAAAGKAMTDEGLCDKVKVSGLGLPDEMKEYTLSGCAPKFALWSFTDLGRLGEYTIEKDPTRDNGLRVLMGPFTVYDKSNVEEG